MIGESTQRELTGSHSIGMDPYRVAFYFESLDVVGHYRVERSARVGLNRPGGLDQPPLWEKVVGMVETVEVVAAGVDDRVTLVDDPELTGRMRREYELRAFQDRSPSSDQNDWLSHGPDRTVLRIWPNVPAPVSVAFRVQALRGAEEIEVGYWYCWKGAMAGVGKIEIDRRQLRSARVELVLRTDTEVARRMVDPGEVWDGEMRLNSIILRPAVLSGP